ncbi:MAG: glutamate racemase [Chlamydiota bacterium]
MSYKIGIFDSGIGGLTVLKAIQNCCPGHQIIYFGDTAKVPYGEKSSQTIQKYSVSNAEFLLSQGVDILVVACNTATAYALELLKERFQIPLVGVVAPGAKRAVELSKNRHIAVIGTKGTVSSDIYKKEIYRMDPSIKVTSQACPLFVPLVEEGWIDHPATELIIKEYLTPLLEMDIDTLLLGCTHYPLLSKAIHQHCEGKISIIDSAHACAENVKALVGNGKNGLDCTKYFVSDDPDKFRLLGKQLLNLSINELELTSG